VNWASLMGNRTFKSYLHVRFQCAITTTVFYLYAISMLWYLRKRVNNWLKESMSVEMSHLLKRIRNSMLKVAHIKIFFFISRLLKNDSHLISNFHAQHLCWKLLLLGLSRGLLPLAAVFPFLFLGFIIDRILFLLLILQTWWKIIL